PLTPVSTAIESEESASNARNACTNAAAVGLSMALRTWGRLIVTIKMEPLRSVLTLSVSISNPLPPGIILVRLYALLTPHSRDPIDRVQKGGVQGSFHV